MSTRVPSRLLAAGVLAMSLALGQAALAQDFPTRPIRMVVGFPPGGGNDLIGRIVATKLSERLGKQVLVDNRAGASGVVASEIVAASPPDGHTIMVVSVAHTANPSLYKLKYDTETAFTPIAMLGAGSTVLTVNPGVPATSVQELIDLARNSPGKLNLAPAGVGTYQHMASSMFVTMARIDVVQVPFKGGGPAIIDVVGGHTQLSIITLANATGHLKSGKLRALAIGSAKRLASYPDLPTIAEAGVPGYEADNWWGVVGPAGIPKPIVEKLAAEIAVVQAMSEVEETLAKEGAEPVERGAAEFAGYLSREMAKWSKVVKDGNIKLQ